MGDKRRVFDLVSVWYTVFLIGIPQMVFSKTPAGIPAALQDYIESIECSLNDHQVSVNFDKRAANRYYIEIAWEFNETKELEDLNFSVIPKFRPTFHWAPHLTPSPENIIAQHVFRSPALIVHDEARWMALIPDLTLLQTQPDVPWYLDMDAEDNQLTIGMAESRPVEHVLYERMKSTRYPAGSYRIGFYVLVSSEDKHRKNPFGDVNEFMWEQWGEPLFNSNKPDLGADLDVYVAHTYRWAFQNWRDQVWQEFEMNGQRVGAPTFIVNVTQSPNYTGRTNEREFRSIWNQAWFSSLRSASGLFRYARRKGIDSLKRYANLTKELALAFPQDNGLFPGLIATEMEDVAIDGQTYRRSKGWDTRYFGNSNRNPFTDDPKQAPYHLLDMSYTALLMLDWYRELDADERLLDYAKKYGNALLELQRSDGYFPAWLTVDTHRDTETLSQSPESAMSVTFLLKLYQITRKESYKVAALQALRAIGDDIVMEGRWEDFETYWSCSRFGQDHIGQKFSRNQMHKQNTLSIYYCAQAYMEAYKVTNDKAFLEAGQRIIDELLMWQAVWQPSFIHISALGGFGVMNADAEWNDSRQSLFAELIMDYGKILNRDDYIQRGIAAIRASFVLMYCNENQQTKAQWEHRWPFLATEDFGFMMENYGHDGVASSQGIGIGEFTIYDWGNGAAAEAVNRIIDHWGDVF